MTIRIIVNKCVSMDRIIVNGAPGWEKGFRELFVEASKFIGPLSTCVKECFTIYFFILSAYTHHYN